MKPSINAPCPCGSGRKYKRCCRVFHKGTPAPTPERLMRSRYSAYARGEVRYIMQTTHPEGPHHQVDARAWREELAAYCRAVRFDGLEVLDAPPPEGDEATVTFRAELAQGARDLSFVERSVFRRKGPRWLYHSGAPEPA